MSIDFERKVSAEGLTFKLYRGEGAALLAFDLDESLATDDFVGFTIEVRYPGSDRWGALRNRLHFDYPPIPERPRSFKSTEAPLRIPRSSGHPFHEHLTTDSTVIRPPIPRASGH